MTYAEIVKPLCRKLEAAQFSGSSVVLDADAAKAMAKAMENMADEIDRLLAQQWVGHCYNMAAWTVVIFASALALAINIF